MTLDFKLHGTNSPRRIMGNFSASADRRDVGRTRSGIAAKEGEIPTMAVLLPKVSPECKLRVILP